MAGFMTDAWRPDRVGPCHCQPSAGLLAHVLVGKYCDHLPLYRQSGIYAREGVELDRATLADWVGKAAWLVAPLIETIEHHVMVAAKLHADDTPVPVLAPGTGKTKTGRLWVYLRDERPYGGRAPPAVVYRYSPDRKGEHPRAHLAKFRGFLQADGYSALARSTRAPAGSRPRSPRSPAGPTCAASSTTSISRPTRRSRTRRCSGSGGCSMSSATPWAARLKSDGAFAAAWRVPSSTTLPCSS